jgi:hypothetical protein
MPDPTNYFPSLVSSQPAYTALTDPFFTAASNTANQFTYFSALAPSALPQRLGKDPQHYL